MGGTNKGKSGGSSMRKLDFRNVVIAVVGAVINRSVLLMMNPFGIAYFACAYMYKPGRLLVAAASAVGMATAMPPGILLKYIGVILGIAAAVKVLEMRKKALTPLKMALICGIFITIAGFAYSVGLNGLERANVGAARPYLLIRGSCLLCHGFCV